VVTPRTAFWLGEGLAQVESFAPVDLSGRLAARQFTVLLPVTTALARYWGGFDPARVSGAVSALANPLLRSAARAAAMEFSPWPRTLVCAALRRAEAESLTGRTRAHLTPAQLQDLLDDLAIAWARHEPGELPALHCRLALSAQPAALWAAAIRDRAGQRRLVPDPSLLPPGGPALWRRQARWSLSPAARMRACLALALAT